MTINEFISAIKALNIGFFGQISTAQWIALINRAIDLRRGDLRELDPEAFSVHDHVLKVENGFADLPDDIDLADTFLIKVYKGVVDPDYILTEDYYEIRGNKITFESFYRQLNNGFGGDGLYLDYERELPTLVQQESSIPAFSTAKTYAVDDIVYYEQYLWKVITAHTGEFEETNFQNSFDL